MVSTPLKNISQLGWLFPIYGKIKHVPNHQPAIIGFVNYWRFSKWCHQSLRVHLPSWVCSPSITGLILHGHLYDREEGPHRTTIIFWRRPFQSAKPFISVGFWWAPYGSMINQGCAKTLWIAILDSVILTPDMGSWNCPRVPLCIKGALLYASRIGYS